MGPSGTPWRVNDAVAYDLVRAKANEVIAILLADASSAEISAPRLHAEIAEIRRTIITLDGFDRLAVDGLSAWLDERTPNPSRYSS